MKKRYQVTLKNGITHSKSFSTVSKAINEVGIGNIKGIKEVPAVEKDTTPDGLTHQSGKQFLSRKQSNRNNR